MTMLAKEKVLLPDTTPDPLSKPPGTKPGLLDPF